MKILEPELTYKNNLPYEVKLCRIGRQLPHRHIRELELVYCLEGKIHLIASDQDYTLTAGQIHSIDFGDIHFLESSGELHDNVVLLFHLDLSKMSNWDELRYVFFACESNHCYPYQEPAMAEVKDIVLSLSYISYRHCSGLDFNKALQKLSNTLLQYFNWFNYENQDDYMNQDLYNRFTRVLKYIATNYKEKISVSQLAEREHINKNYFSQFVSKTIFSSFSNMVNYIRCYQAEFLLLTTNMSVSDISFECGFSDPKYFYSAFKELWHATPTEHRKKYERYYKTANTKQNRTILFSEETADAKLKNYITRWHIAKTFL